jgi:hypothetical protein
MQISRVPERMGQGRWVSELLGAHDGESAVPKSLIGVTKHPERNRPKRMGAGRGIVTKIDERMATMPRLIVERETTFDVMAHQREVADEQRRGPGGMMSLQNETIIIALPRQLE